MKLKEYLQKHDLSCKKFAFLVGLSEKSGNMAVWRWITDNEKYQQIPRPAMIKKITEITNGDVTPNDFYPE